MKKVLFGLASMRAGGSATSLLNLLSLYKGNGCSIDLFLLEHDGAFLDRAAEVANLLPEESVIASIRCTKDKLKKRGLKSQLIRISYVILHKIFGIRRTDRWFYSFSARKLKGYDIVVAFQEGITTKYMQYVLAKKRVAWCHMDYDSFSVNISREDQQRLYDCFEDIACVSTVVQRSMLENLRLRPDRVNLVYNTIPPLFIRQKAQEPVESIRKRTYSFISMGRFVKRKGFDRVVYAAARLVEQGVDFAWYIIGDGEEFANISEQVVQHKLEDHVILMGIRKNPFPYIAQADCFVMSSESEAQPMVLNEALTLGIPAITTDFSSSREVVKDGVNGLIVPNHAEGLLTGVLRYISNAELQQTIKVGAAEFVYDNDTILRQVSSLMN